jgi:hypothetical protein
MTWLYVVFVQSVFVFVELTLTVANVSAQMCMLAEFRELKGECDHRPGKNFTLSRLHEQPRDVGAVAPHPRQHPREIRRREANATARRGC